MTSLKQKAWEEFDQMLVVTYADAQVKDREHSAFNAGWDAAKKDGLLNDPGVGERFSKALKDSKVEI